MSESPYERRQREAAQRMLKAAMPSVTRMMADIVMQQQYMTGIKQIYTPQYDAMLKSITRSILPTFETPVVGAQALRALRGVNVPALQLDYSSLFPDFAAIQASAIIPLLPSIRLIQDLQRDQFASIIKSARAAVSAMLPPNWQGKDVTIPKDLETLLLDEGLPLAWVPPQEVVVKLFAAETAADRRKVLGARWKTIARACLEELQKVSHADLTEHAEFAVEAAESLLDGRSKSSQALSANLLDTVLRASFNEQDRTAITGQKQRLDIDDYPLRVAIVLGGIWGSHGQFWPSKGDKIPRMYSRHGSAHGVSKRQYSRINALLALMHVVSLLRVLEVDLVEAD